MAKVFASRGTALITGGASGVGLALTTKCHEKGMRVLVADFDSDALKKVSIKFKENVFIHKVDVGKKEDWDALKQTVVKDFNGRINLLALNAGIGKASPWDEPESFEDIYRTNIMGVVNGIGAILPFVKSAATEGPTSIVITGSKQGMTNPPGRPAYNSSKAAVKSIAEHLSWDLRNDGIPVHLLIPGWTYTGMSGNRADTGESKPDGAWWPSQVVDYLEKKMQEGQFWVICPDNEVSEELDRKRLMWTAGDAIQGRPPLNRWREDWKDKAKDSIDKMNL